MSTRLIDYAGKFKWYHWAGGIGTAGAFNVGILIGMAKTYRWCFADDEAAMCAFREKYGVPSEAERLELFAWMSTDWDAKIGARETTGPHLYRKELLAEARGDVLEVAVGSGRCFGALKEAEEVKTYVGIDCVGEMLQQARPKLEDLPFPARVEQANAHRLPYASQSFDTVVGTICLCSLERPADALEEMARVCRPDGQILLLEPGVASSWVVRVSQRYLGLVPNPKHPWEFGWYDDLNPPALVRSCPKLELTSWHTRTMGNWYLLKAKPMDPASCSDVE